MNPNQQQCPNGDESGNRVCPERYGVYNQRINGAGKRSVVLKEDQ